jgi:hypothetical protein
MTHNSDPRESEHDFAQAQDLIKQRRVYPRSSKELGKLLGQIVTKRGIAAQMSSQAIEDAWYAIAHNRWPQRTRVGALKRGKLEIMVRDSVANQELTFEKKTLLEQLKRRLPDAQISDLVFRVGGIG